MKEAIGSLKYLRENPNFAGVCYNCLLGLPSEFIHKMFEEWEHFSGDRDYPIPDTRANPLTPKKVYNETKHMYDARTKYGRLRLELIDYCIDYLENKKWILND